MKSPSVVFLYLVPLAKVFNHLRQLFIAERSFKDKKTSDLTMKGFLAGMICCISFLPNSHFGRIGFRIDRYLLAIDGCLGVYKKLQINHLLPGAHAAHHQIISILLKAGLSRRNFGPVVSRSGYDNATTSASAAGQGRYRKHYQCRRAMQCLVVAKPKPIAMKMETLTLLISRHLSAS